MKKSFVNLNIVNCNKNCLVINEEQRELLEKLDKLQSLLFSFTANVKRLGLNDELQSIGFDTDKYINRCQRKMREIATAKEQYVKEE